MRTEKEMLEIFRLLGDRTMPKENMEEIINAMPPEHADRLYARMQSFVAKRDLKLIPALKEEIAQRVSLLQAWVRYLVDQKDLALLKMISDGLKEIAPLLEWEK